MGKGHRKYKIGYEFETSRSGKVIVTGYCESGGYNVEFIDTGFVVKELSATRLTAGKIQDHTLDLPPTAYKHGLPKKIVREYAGIWERSHFHLAKPSRQKSMRRYEGCYLHEDFNTIGKYVEWRDKQLFTDAVDYLGNFYQVEKDILVPGNNCYGPHTCVFVPQQINGFFSFIQGVFNPLVGSTYESSSGMYHAKIRLWPKGKRRFGSYSTAEEAHNRYCIEKEKQAKNLAEHFRGLVDNRVIIALNNFSTEEYILAQQKRDNMLTKI